MEDRKSPAKLNKGKTGIWRWMGWELAGVDEATKVLTWTKAEYANVYWRPTAQHKAGVRIDCLTFDEWNEKVEKEDAIYTKVYKNALQTLKCTFETSDRLENTHHLIAFRYEHVTSILGVATVSTEYIEDNDEDVFKLILFFTLRPPVRKMGFSEQFVQTMLAKFTADHPGKRVRLLTEVRIGVWGNTGGVFFIHVAKKTGNGLWRVPKRRERLQIEGR